MAANLTSETDLASEILVLAGQDPAAFEPTGDSDEVFRRASRKQLLDCAQRLGLKGISKLPKEELAGRVLVAFQELPRSKAGPPGIIPSGTGALASPVIVKGSAGDIPINGESSSEDVAGTFARKFDLGRTEAPPVPENIPWGYDQDRVTAMVVDPDRLYVYWEVTDSAIDRVRPQLGTAGTDAWLNLRVYDITGRLFDGTNAHSYFDHRLERYDRQWFFAINKPTSTACVEVGLMSSEGYFAKIARSGRIDFPRREPVGDGGAEWLSVRTATGPVGDRVAGGAHHGGEHHGGAPGPGGGGGGEQHQDWGDWTKSVGFPVPGGHRVFGRHWEWSEAEGSQWSSDLTRTEWVGPLLRSEWESGPFTYPVEVPSPVEYHEAGEVTVRTEGGKTHVVYGPWQVVIRGLGARAERRVLGTWEYRRQISVTGGASRAMMHAGVVALGSSEWLLSGGGSEQIWLGSSEIMMRGASELWLMGASEVMMRGASETLFSGASELRFRGASERRIGGASEVAFRGASERMVGGASETLLAGASERHLGGASELGWGGASEALLAGSSERYPVPLSIGESGPNGYPIPPQFPGSK